MIRVGRLLASSFTVVALGAAVASAQPGYLLPLLTQIEGEQGAKLTQTLDRVQERALAGVYSQDDLAHIVRALTRRAEGSPETRAKIITVLGQIGRPESVPAIMQYAREPDQMVRLSAHQALGWIGDERALPLLESIASERSAVDPDSYENFMLRYAIGAIRIKKALREGPEGDRFPLVRTTLLTEPNWLVRADIARSLERWPGAEVWDVVFDSYERWPEPEQYAGRLGTILGLRYQYDPAGFIAALRQRSVPVRVFGLGATLDVADASDLTALMEMSEADPDAQVRELAASAVSRLMAR